MDEDDVIEGMTQIISKMETYRALLEARGFSPFVAEAMTVQYHGLICNELDRQRVARAKLLGVL